MCEKVRARSWYTLFYVNIWTNTPYYVCITLEKSITKYSHCGYWKKYVKRKGLDITLAFATAKFI